MQETNAKSLFALPLAAALALGLAIAAFTGTAFAEGEGPDTTPVEPTELQLRIESTADAYNSATARADELQQRIDENSARIVEVEAQLPAQREKADVALVSMYKLASNKSTLTGALMDIENLGDFLTAYEYLTGITANQMNEVNRLRDLQQELNSAQAQLLAEKAEADEVKAQAQQALAEAQAARQEAMAVAAAAITPEEVEAVRQQVVEAAVEEAQAEAAAAVEQGATEEEAQAKVEEARVQAEEVAATTIDATTVASGGVDWSMSKEEFVSEWSGRIDTYLEGSPMEGTGETFAEAAWDNGVDPRWSPAIANTESTKGEYTFADHNAWGWGSASWDSWEEAINEHVEGLAEGYGSTITEESAEKYCPPEAEFWYETTLEQMNQI